jgi:hypothetical protein
MRLEVVGMLQKELILGQTIGEPIQWIFFTISVHVVFVQSNLYSNSKLKMKMS